ncbi:hypothetical protein [Paenibacillus sedimenti]|uniref:Uncharacterized protein n=1 Tax=Paenibacillus sedimenti TaxID=2770274 RepID=A0A926QK41_9BACL|nr:hypothetical protein [Paenibacillus sedimenti]MBD0381087.1 hypothetical protein [Paenibacillus sedimenti]
MSISVPKGFLRFSGWTLFLGGIMGVIGQVLHGEDVPDSVAHIPAFVNQAVNLHVLLAYASTLILLGLPGLFLRQSSGLKKWGWIALPILFIGLMLEIFHGPVQILAYPIMFDGIKDDAALKVISDQINNLSIDKFPFQLAVLIPIVPCILIGLLLTGLSSIKARVLSKGPGILCFINIGIFIISQFVHLPIFNYSFSLIHLVFVWFGAILAFESYASVSSSSSTSTTQNQQI